MNQSQMTEEERLRRMLAESEIRELAARFSDAVTRNDAKAFRALWTENGVWEIREPYPASAEGPAAIVSLLQKLIEPWAFFVQLTHSGVVEFESQSTAVARWIMSEVARSPDGKLNYDNLAMYEDHVVCGSDSIWRFSKRTYNYIWLSESPLVGRSFPLPANLGR